MRGVFAIYAEEMSSREFLKVIHGREAPLRFESGTKNPGIEERHFQDRR
jgi:hypothetical protein